MGINFRSIHNNPSAPRFPNSYEVMDETDDAETDMLY